MRKRLCAAIILLLCLSGIGQKNYTRHYKEPKTISKGTVLILGGVTFTIAPIIAEFTSSTTPFKNKPQAPGININPNAVAMYSGISVTVVGLITKIAER